MKTLEAAKRTFIKLPKVPVTPCKFKTFREDDSGSPFP